MNIPGTLRKYDIEPIEMAAVAVYLHTDSQSFAWSQTIGLTKNSKQPATEGSRFFARIEIQTYLYDCQQKLNKDNGKRFDIETTGQKGLSINSEDNDVEITADNVKQILERELKGITDPAKRADIIMKIGEYVGIKNSDQDDPLTPTIYLPARCSQCKQLKSNSI